GDVRAADEGGILIEAEGGFGADVEAAGEVFAGGEEDFSAAFGGAVVEGFLEDGGVFGDAIGFGAEVFDVEFVGGGEGGAGGVGGAEGGGEEEREGDGEEAGGEHAGPFEGVD